jgi:peptide deformylase
VISFETGDDIDLEIECSGLLSRCLQHEIDHLDGLLFIDRMALPDKVKLNSKITKLKRKYKKTGYLKSK